MTDWMDFVRQVKNANDIVSVIGSYIDLTNRGQNFLARCPFHGERTPSFSVSRKGFYKCFGCGESGDVINFVQKYESCSFYEAVEILAKRANMTMPATERSMQDDGLVRKKKTKDTCLEILKETAKFYFRCYHGTVGRFAKEYMTQRGFADSTAKTFGIGYSPDMYSLVKHLTEQKFDLNQCQEAGVLSCNSSGKYYDALCGRLIVPIMDINNKVIAFGGRALDEKTTRYGKYKNTRETQVFIKTNNLYAINNAKHSKQSSNLPYIIMVEGYMDVIAMYQAGFAQCVASMGTSLTSGQAKLLSRLVDKVYICYDGDSAGQSATIRGLDILTVEGLEVLVMTVPDKLDPDEYISKYGKEAFAQLITDALPLIDYKLSVLERHYDIFSSNSAVRNNALVKYVTACVKVLAPLNDIEQERYLSVVSAKTGYSVEYLKRKLINNNDQPSYSDDTTLTLEQKALYHILSCLLADDIYRLPEHQLHIADDRLDKITKYIYQSRAEKSTVQIDMIYSLCPAQDKAFYNLLTAQSGIEPSEKDILYYDECVVTYLVAQYKAERQLLIDKMRSTDSQCEQYAMLSQQIAVVNQQIDKLTQTKR